jgi:hypothetical protein
LVIGYIEHLQNVNANEDYAVAVIHTSQTTTGHTRPPLLVKIFTVRCSAAAFNVDVPLSLGSRSVPCLSYQLLTTILYYTIWLIIYIGYVFYCFWLCIIVCLLYLIRIILCLRFIVFCCLRFILLRCTTV